jgi:hypothetical protein
MGTVSEGLQKLWEHNKAFFNVGARKVQMRRAGGSYRARYAGEATVCFGATSEDAYARLKFWSEHGKA